MAECESDDSPNKPFTPENWKQLNVVETMSMEELTEKLKYFCLNDQGHEIILRKRLKEHTRQSISGKSVHQLYDYILIIDFEATCDKTDNPNYKHEIIEFPIILLDISTLEVVDFFHSYCRPVLNKSLTEFCRELTQISQSTVNAAPRFVDVLASAEAWMQKHELFDKKFAVACDCNADMATFMRIQSRISDIKVPDWCRHWINIKKHFRNFYSIPRDQRVNLHSMLDYLGLEFKGQWHSGLSDARNIGRVVIHLLRDGCVLHINERLSASVRPTFTAPVSWQLAQRNLVRFTPTDVKKKPTENRSKERMRKDECSELLSDETVDSLADLFYMIKLKK